MSTHGHSADHGDMEERSGAGDEPVAVVAIGVFGAILLGIIILWIYSSTH